MSMAHASRSLMVLVVLISTAISLFVIADSPLPARADLLTDDGLFIRLAGSLRAREWLGSFDQLTLAKGPAYPAVIALADAMSIQLKVAEQLLYLLAALLMACVVSLLSGSRLVGAVLFAVLALMPYFFLDGSLRVLRESVYTGASVAVVGGVAWVFLIRLASSRPWRVRDLLFSCVVGAMVGFYWLVREEGVWLAPSLAVIAGGGLLVVLVRARRSTTEPSEPSTEARLTVRPLSAVVRTTTAVLAILLGASLVVGTVAFLNLRNYGVPLVNDFRDGTFPAAIGAFSRIGAVPWQRYVPAARESRLAAYRVSPAAAELEAFLERPDYFYRQVGCRVAASSEFVRDRSIEAPCDEFYYGWFTFALRDAIAAAGHWDNASEAQAFMARLADEINTACDMQRIPCGPAHDSITPPLRSQYIGEVLGLLPFGFDVLTDMRGETGGAQSRGSIPELARFARVTHSSIAAPAPEEAALNYGVRLSGWVDSLVGSPTISVQRTEAGSLEVSQQIDTVDNLADAGGAVVDGDSPARASIRFTLETSCLAPDCALVVMSEGEPLLSIPLDSFRQPRSVATDTVTLSVAEVVPYADPELTQLKSVIRPQRAFTLELERAIAQAYAVLLPILSLLAAIGMLAGLLVADVRRRWSMLIILGSACAVAVPVRLVLIGLIEVSAWPGAMRTAYVAPALPFLLTFTVIGLFLLLAAARRVGRGRSQANDLPAPQPPGDTTAR